MVGDIEARFIAAADLKRGGRCPIAGVVMATSSGCGFTRTRRTCALFRIIGLVFIGMAWFSFAPTATGFGTSVCDAATMR